MVTKLHLACLLTACCIFGCNGTVDPELDVESPADVPATPVFHKTPNAATCETKEDLQPVPDDVDTVTYEFLKTVFNSFL